MPLPEMRDDLQILDGYHSPQLDVEVRLNTNEAPGPPPLAFNEAVADAVRALEWHRYPDRTAHQLRQSLADLHQLHHDQVFCANGSNEVLQTLLLAFGGNGRSVLTFEPTYAMHAHIARIAGANTLVGERDPDFCVNADQAVGLISIHKPSVTFLCSPNNPTGTTESQATIRAVLAAVEAAGGLLVVDEAYGQFAPWSALELVDDQTPLVVTRTFSKTWAMAGARLGYAIGPRPVMEDLNKVVLPYHLDGAKQAAGVVALDFVAEMEQRVSRIVEQRGRLAAELAGMGARVWPSGANFVLFRPPRLGRHGAANDGDALWEALVKRSVLVRNTASWDRLEGCLRVTVGTEDDNTRFLAATREALRELGAQDG